MPKISFNVKRLDGLKSGPEREDYWDAQLHGFVLRITPEGTKTFCVMYRIAGQRRRFTLGSYPVLALADAREMAKDALALVRRGIDPIEEKKRREDEEYQRRLEGFTFEMLAKRFLDEHVSNLRSKYEVHRSFNKYLIPEFGKIKAQELKRIAIRECLGRMARETPVMANRCLGYMSKMYNWGLSMDLVEYNPCAGIPRPGRENQRDRVLSGRARPLVGYRDLLDAGHERTVKQDRPDFGRSDCVDDQRCQVDGHDG